MCRKANGLLQYVQEHGRDKLKWNNGGQLLVNGEVISGSHIIDLVRYAVCPKATCSPVGSGLSFKALRSLDMPMALIANVRFVNYTIEETDHMLQEGSGYIVKKTNQWSTTRLSLTEIKKKQD